MKIQPRVNGKSSYVTFVDAYLKVKTKCDPPFRGKRRMNFVLTVGMSWLFLLVVSWEMISLLADKPSPKPGENVTISATVKEQCTIIWMNNATDSVLAVCDAANCTPYATSRYRFSYQGVNITNFDWSEDGFVWKAQCGYATATYIFSKPNGSPSVNPELGILFVGIITIWMIAN